MLFPSLLFNHGEALVIGLLELYLLCVIVQSHEKLSPLWVKDVLGDEEIGFEY